MDTINIKIGARERAYVLLETSAPESYDSGTSLTLHEGDSDGSGRLVLVEEGQVEWHFGRWASGLYRHGEAELDRLMRAFVEQKIWKAIVDGLRKDES